MGRELELARDQRGDAYAIAQGDAVADQSGHLLARQDRPEHIERIDGANADELPVGRALAYVAQQGERFGQRELFAGKAVDEAAASNETARFQTMEYAQ